MTYETTLRRRARRQEGVVAAWQLRGDGLTVGAIEHHVRGLRELHDGVYVTGDAPVTRAQLWWAAAVTAPGRYLSHASAGAYFGFRPWQAGFEVVTARGSGGPRQFGSVLVCRSTPLAGNVHVHGLPVTTAERALADLCRHLMQQEFARCVREALRLRVTTCPRIQVHLARQAARNRPRRLALLAARYARLPIAGRWSDAESVALAVLDAAGYPPPQVDQVVAGHKPDLAWRSVRHIVELDGPGFHQFPDADLSKQRAWERAGWTVARVPTADVYDRPERLLSAAEPALRGGFVRRPQP